MEKKRKTPIVSLVFLMAMGIWVAQLTAADTETPKRAMQQVGFALKSFAAGVQAMINASAKGEFVFVEIEKPDMPLLVNEKSPLPQGFVPTELVRMREYCDASVVKIKGSETEGEREAVDALMTMLRAAMAQGVGDWQITAGYRSVAYQQELWDRKVYEYRQQGMNGDNARKATAKYVAVPGASEHHTGLAFDVTVPGRSFSSTEQCEWLAENCYDYGFIIRYTADKVEITGIEAEPWHVRYVGTEHAHAIKNSGWCLEEYIENQL